MLSRMRSTVVMAMIMASAFLFVAGRAHAQSTSATYPERKGPYRGIGAER